MQQFCGEGRERCKKVIEARWLHKAAMGRVCFESVLAVAACLAGR